MTYYSQHAKVWVSVDCIIFGFDEGKLRVLIGRRHMDPGRGEWSLYGGFVRSDESINDAANRVLFDLTGLRNLYMRQVGAFGSVDRDPGERVISIAYYALINVKDYEDELRKEVSSHSLNSRNSMRPYMARISTSAISASGSKKWTSSRRLDSSTRLDQSVVRTSIVLTRGRTTKIRTSSFNIIYYVRRTERKSIQG